MKIISQICICALYPSGILSTLTWASINSLEWHAASFLCQQHRSTCNHFRNWDWSLFVVDLLDYVAIDSIANPAPATLYAASQFASFADIDCLWRKFNFNTGITRKFIKQIVFNIGSWAISYSICCSISIHLQSMKIKAASAAIRSIVTTAKKMIKYSIGISFRNIAAHSIWNRNEKKNWIKCFYFMNIFNSWFLHLRSHAVWLSFFNLQPSGQMHLTFTLNSSKTTQR